MLWHSIFFQTPTLVGFFSGENHFAYFKEILRVGPAFFHGGVNNKSELNTMVLKSLDTFRFLDSLFF